MRLVVTALLLVSALVSGCGEQANIDRFAPKEESDLAKLTIQRIADRDFAPVEALLDASLARGDARRSLEQLASLIPVGTPLSVKTVGASTNKSVAQSGTSTVYNLTFEYEYPRAWLVANVVFRRDARGVAVLGIHVQPLQQSLEETNRFTLSGKGASHYAVLIAAILVPLFIVATLVACFRTTVSRRKWLWYVFIALGFVQLSFNWSSGATQIQPLSFLLLGAGFFRASPAAPLVLNISVPIGALVFLAMRRSLATPAEVDPAVEATD